MRCGASSSVHTGGAASEITRGREIAKSPKTGRKRRRPISSKRGAIATCRRIRHNRVKALTGLERHPQHVALVRLGSWRKAYARPFRQHELGPVAELCKELPDRRGRVAGAG